MLSTNGRLKLAIQKDGRITEESITLLKAMGLDFDIRSRALFSPCRNFPLDILAVRDDDIPEYVQDGVSDFGWHAYPQNVLNTWLWSIQLFLLCSVNAH